MDKQPANILHKQERTAKGTFISGVSGNPQGRARGSRNKATEAALALLEGEAQALTRRAVELALQGDMGALRLCLERIIPTVKERALPALELPTISTVQDLPRLTSAVLQAVSNGELLPSEAAALSGIVAQHSKMLDISELEGRLTQIEQLLKDGGK